MKLIFAPEAREDMENIFRYYVSRNENYAVELYNQVIEEAELSLNFPKMGQKELLLNEYPEDYYSLVVWHSYKIVYFLENDAVNVVAVFDCRQNPNKLKPIIHAKNQK